MTIRWGIIGCGDVTEVKSGPALQKANGSTLTAVMRRTSGLAEDYARRHNVPHWFDDAEALITCPEVDAVYIATPPGSHLSYALRACAAGKPAYVEKPMARSETECKRMNEAFEQAGLPLYVAYYRRAFPRFITARSLLEEGRIGQITSVHYRYASPAHHGIDPDQLPWHLQAEHAGGGLFMDLGCHTLDLLDFLLGPLQAVAGTAANMASPYAVEDTVAMHFTTPTGAPGTAAWNFASEASDDTIEIFGTDGRLVTSTFGDEPMLLEAHEDRETLVLPKPAHVQQPLIQTIVDALRGAGSCPSTGASAARTARVMDTVLASYYGTREDAFWNRPATWPGRRNVPLA